MFGYKLNKMKVKIKKLHPDAVIPSYSKEGDAGLDLTCVDINVDENLLAVCKTGLSVEIPKGYVGLIFPRSSITKKGVRLANSVGVIDSGYRGEIMFKFELSPLNVLKTCLEATNNKDAEDIPEFYSYEEGERVGQLIIIPYPQIEFEEVDELSDTERGSGGYGSTGS